MGADGEKQGNPQEKAFDFETVRKSEQDVIFERRASPENGDAPDNEKERMKLAGLAFSGGGIRSAVFNLGFIQGLANRNSLHVFDYLSTVSGGGYIGGWLSALVRRQAAGVPAGETEMRAVQDKFLKTPPVGAVPGAGGFPEAESAAVRFVRRYSNYLTPRLGLSGDALALTSLMVRNVTVIQFLLLSMLVAAFAGLLLLMQADEMMENEPLHLGVMSALIAALFFKSLYSALTLQEAWSGKDQTEKTPTRDITVGVLFPALGAGVCTAITLAEIAPVEWAWGGAAAAALTYLIAWWLLCPPQTGRGRAGVWGGAALLGVAFFLLFSRKTVGHALAFAPLTAMVIFSLVMTLHLALAGSAVTEQVREWWARLGGQGVFLAFGWTAAFLFLLYVPPLMQYGWDNAFSWLLAGGGLWTILTGSGTRLAQSKATGAGDSKLPLEIAVLFVPWMFLAGLLGLVAWLFIASLPGIFLGGESLEAAINHYQQQLPELSPYLLLGVLLVSGGIFRMLLKYIDLNIFSAHSFYLNRLARTFLGASQDQRHPNPYTGFDPDDDIPLSHLAGQRPIHLINATLNLTGGEDLAWQTRRGACFTFTPAYSGYTARDSKGKDFGGFRPTAGYGGGLSLATAVAVSGAAASPNMGFHTATSVAALLTAFNLRLARWCPNPIKAEWSHSAPKNAAAPLFAELFGDTNGRKAWVNLSDGGHFENLGLYELIRRRSALILVTDAAADGDYRFDDLAMAVRKIRVDFGVRVEIAEKDLDQIRPAPHAGADQGTPRFSKAHWAYGRICYPDGAPGYLIYVKSAIGDDAPIDIRQYRDANPTFPHESTADQWFDEDQFEAYRHLGQIIAEQLLDEMPVKDGTGQTAAAIIDKLYQAAEAHFNKIPGPHLESGCPTGALS